MKKVYLKLKFTPLLLIVLALAVLSVGTPVYASEEHDLSRQSELFTEFTSPLMNQNSRSGSATITLRGIPIPELGQDRFVVGFSCLEDEEFVAAIVENLLTYTGISEDMLEVTSFTVCPKWIEAWERGEERRTSLFPNGDLQYDLDANQAQGYLEESLLDDGITPRWAPVRLRMGDRIAITCPWSGAVIAPVATVGHPNTMPSNPSSVLGIDFVTAAHGVVLSGDWIHAGNANGPIIGRVTGVSFSNTAGVDVARASFVVEGQMELTTPDTGRRLIAARGATPATDARVRTFTALSGTRHGNILHPQVNVSGPNGRTWHNMTVVINLGTLQFGDSGAALIFDSTFGTVPVGTLAFTGNVGPTQMAVFSRAGAY